MGEGSFGLRMDRDVKMVSASPGKVAFAQEVNRLDYFQCAVQAKTSGRTIRKSEN
jgi:hypothetical protein